MTYLGVFNGHEVTLAYAIGHEIREVTFLANEMTQDWITGKSKSVKGEVTEFALRSSAILVISHSTETCVGCERNRHGAKAA